MERGTMRGSRTRAVLGPLAGVVLLAAAGALANVSPASALSSSLQQVANFGNNPSGLQMFEYVPASVAARPAVVVVLHFCTGSGPVMFSNTRYAALADQPGHHTLHPSRPRA